MGLQPHGYRKQDKDKSRSYLRCISKASQLCGRTDFEIEAIVCQFFEEVAWEVCKGQTVRIPGFGIFCARTYQPKDGRDPNRCYPAFDGARTFKIEVMERCVPNSDNERSFERHRIDTHPSSGGRKRRKRNRSMAVTFDYFRKERRRQAEQHGLDLP